jgi:hypothetical protein
LVIRPCLSTASLLTTGVALAAVACGGSSVRTAGATGGTSGTSGTSGTTGGYAGTGGSSGGTATGAGGDDDSAPNDTALSPWSGHTYLLSLAKGDWTVPRGIGIDLIGFAPAFMFDIGGSGTDLTSMFGYGPGTTTDANGDLQLVTPANATQDSCGPTSQISFSGASYPSSTIGPAHIRMHVLNTAVTPPVQVTADVYDLKFTDILPYDGTTSTTGTLEATLDFRQLYVLFQALGPTRTPASVCRTMIDTYTPSSCAPGDASCTVACQPCPTADASPTCLTVKAERVGALEALNFSISEVVEASRPATCADTQLQQ